MELTRSGTPYRPGTAHGASAPVDISVLVVGYNGQGYLDHCLSSLDRHAEGGPSFEVLIADNASTPELHVPQLSNFVPTLYRSVVNLGFGGACNWSAARAQGRYVLLLNPDAEVRAGTLANLLKAASQVPMAGVIGGRTVTPTGELDPKSCWGAPSLWSMVCFATGLSTAFPSHHLTNPESLGQWKRDSMRDVGVVTGSLFLVPTTVWRQLGGFDSDYFMYGEDADLCLRARRSGYRTLITPLATATHVGGASSTTEDKSVMLLRGKVTYLRKNHHGVRGFLMSRMLLSGVGLRAALAKASGGRGGHWAGAWARRREWAAGY